MYLGVCDDVCDERNKNYRKNKIRERKIKMLCEPDIKFHFLVWLEGTRLLAIENIPHLE